ncbi:MAG: hypothetical protein LRY71_16715 [Bacillaceae bacterium]|nr:hypothetical protein [Bacillaceae bacterium]
MLNEVNACKDKEKIELIKSQFKFGMSLIGLAVIQNYTHLELEENENEEIDPTEKVYEITKMLSPIFIPMINSLSELNIVADLKEMIDE